MSIEGCPNQSGLESQSLNALFVRNQVTSKGVDCLEMNGNDDFVQIGVTSN